LTEPTFKRVLSAKRDQLGDSLVDGQVVLSNNRIGGPGTDNYFLSRNDRVKWLYT